MNENNLNIIREIVKCSPKASIREARRNEILSDDEAKLALGMIDDRNVTAHTYHEGVAYILFKRLASYSVLMNDLLDRMKNKANLETI